MTRREIIEAFGGNAALAEALGLTQPAVSNWQHRGIALKWWPVLIDLAAEKGLSGITLATLRAAAPIKENA